MLRMLVIIPHFSLLTPAEEGLINCDLISCEAGFLPVTLRHEEGAEIGR